MVILQITTYRPRIFIEHRNTIHLWNGNSHQMYDLTKYGTKPLGSCLHFTILQCNNNNTRIIPRSNLFLFDSEDIPWLTTQSANVSSVYQIFLSVQPSVFPWNRRCFNTAMCSLWMQDSRASFDPALISNFQKKMRLFIHLLTWV